VRSALSADGFVQEPFHKIDPKVLGILVRLDNPKSVFGGLHESWQSVCAERPYHILFWPSSFSSVKNPTTDLPFVLGSDVQKVRGEE
jgi:hypothetical protein